MNVIVKQRPRLVDHALELASCSWPVFPCGDNKKPLFESKGYTEAVTDPRRVREMFGNPAARSIGVATGEQFSNVVVLDLDPGSEAWWEANKHRLPETLTHLTPRGGRHMIYLYPAGHDIRNSASRIASHVDIRANGGYAVFPPSPRYTVLHGFEIAEMPDWLIHECLKAAPVHERPEPQPPHEPTGRDIAYAQSAFEMEIETVRTAHEGQRHTLQYLAALKLGNFVGAGCLAFREVEGELVGAAMQTGTPEREARRTVRDGLEFGMHSPRYAPDDWVADNGAIPEFNIRYGVSRDRVAKMRRDRRMYGHFAPRGTMTFIHAGGGTGKTQYCCSVLISVLMGGDRSILGERMESGLEDGENVLYVLQEDDTDELEKLLYACVQYYNVPEYRLQSMGLWGVDAGGRLVVAELDAKGRVTPSPQFKHFVTWAKEHKYAMIVLDSLGLIHRCDSTKSDQMRQVATILSDAAREIDCQLIVLAHDNKSGEAGSLNAMLGARSMIDVSRATLSMKIYSKDEIETFGYDPASKHICITPDSKTNRGPMILESIDFEVVPVQLPNGDSRSVLKRVYPEPKKVLSAEDIEQIIDTIDAGPKDGEFYCRLRSAQNDARWAGHVFLSYGCGKKDAQSWIDKLIKQGSLREDSYTSADRNSRRVNCLRKA